jgi:hypothetical protein
LLPARLAMGLFVAVGLAVPLAATVHSGLSGPQLHGEPVAVAGPPVVAQEATRLANDLPGEPIRARVIEADDNGLTPAVEEARDVVRSGEVSAAYVINLIETTDTLLLADRLPDDVARLIEADVGAVSAGYGRTQEVERVASPGSAPRSLPGRLVALLVAVGIALAASITAWRGPVATTAARGTARFAGTAVAGIVAGVAAAALVDTGSPVGTATASAAILVVSAWLVFAAEAVLGLAGLGLATGLLIGPAAHLLGDSDPAYLPSPWFEMHRYGPDYAALRLLQHDLFGIQVEDVRSWFLLAGWAAIAVLTMVVARRERPGDA